MYKARNPGRPLALRCSDVLAGTKYRLRDMSRRAMMQPLQQEPTMERKMNATYTAREFLELARDAAAEADRAVERCRALVATAQEQEAKARIAANEAHRRVARIEAES